MIAIVDYGMGNLRSVQKAFETLGKKPVITSDAFILEQADHVVLPGVGAIEDAVAELKKKNLTDVLRHLIQKGVPFLGICLGLQLLFEKSFENGEHECLGVIPGSVVPFQLPKEYSIPHMGWNQLCLTKPDNPLYQGIPDMSYVYFVHTYFVVPKNPEFIATTTDYGQNFCSSIWQGNLFATQFHPEKSQAVGLRMLKNFMDYQNN